MNAKPQTIQESEQLLLTKCAKCQNNAEFDPIHHRPLCKHCHQLELIEDESEILSSDYHTELKHELQSEKFNSLPYLKKANSLHFEDENQHQTKGRRKSPTKSYHSLIVENGKQVNIKPQTSEDSEQERLEQEERKLQEVVREDNLKLKIERKVIVGSGFTFDMTDFFRFKKKQLGAQQEQTFFQSISGSRVAWIILLYTICSTALIPGWIMNIKATKLLRQQWRFLMQALMVLPFAFYEKRTSSKQQAQKYSLKYIFTPENIIKPYISSFASSLWFLFVLTSFQWTYVSHGIVLGSLSNFFLSIGRSLNKNSHDLQSGGQVLVVLGILLVLHDSISVEKHQISMDQLTYLNTFYLQRSWWQRVGGDMVQI